MSNPRGPVAIFSGGGTGGHLYPALALLEGVQAIRHDLRPFFLGAQRGLEARVVPEQGLENLLLPVQGFRRASLWGNLEVLSDLFRSLLLTAETFSRLRPGVVVVSNYIANPINECILCAQFFKDGLCYGRAFQFLVLRGRTLVLAL